MLSASPSVLETFTIVITSSMSLISKSSGKLRIVKIVHFFKINLTKEMRLLLLTTTYVITICLEM